ncbi:unnamed protein product [Nippostrongylus brasiliensis]|uniref:Bestrophin homolog n=1 Tax=Nippostrongylus brasiliensis TaxID=27835 RepID=A0A0N4YS51_NIPBR|nr:unnamed protein product [Nippostrongylus brasiliensis]
MASVLRIYWDSTLPKEATKFLVNLVRCIVFTGFFRWYLYCCSKETLKELQSVDRERILTIDAESLASSSFYDSPRLPLKRNSIELCSAGDIRPPSCITLHD